MSKRRRMTFDEFLGLLGQMKWHLRDGKFIRLDGSRVDCPWLCVADFSRVKVVHGNFPDREKLFDAADNAPGHDPEIRRRLLEACGLEAK